MSFINTRLPQCVAYGFAGGPEWSTLIVPKDNGGEQRNRRCQYPLYRYSASFLNLSEVGQREVMAAFMATAGRWAAFRFHDRMDYTATSEAIAPEVGTSEPVQLVKAYSLGAATTTRLISAPVAGTVTVYRNGVAVAGTLDDTTGLFTPAAPWVAGTFTWSGEFDVWVRFDSDWNAFSRDAPDAHNSTIDLIEVRRQ